MVLISIYCCIADRTVVLKPLMGFNIMQDWELELFEWSQFL